MQMTTMKRFRTARHRAAAGLCVLAFCVGVQAQGRNFDIAGGELKTALDAYALQSGTQLIYKIEDVKGLSSKGLKRTLSDDEALGVLLEGTALTMRRDSSGAVVIFLELPARPEKRAAADEPGTLGTVVVSAGRRRPQWRLRRQHGRAPLRDAGPRADRPARRQRVQTPQPGLVRAQAVRQTRPAVRRQPGADRDRAFLNPPHVRCHVVDASKHSQERLS
jgi:hypothetical protein